MEQGNINKIKGYSCKSYSLILLYKYNYKESNIWKVKKE